ncbi:nucleotidyl transferase AbiEii/AbiGii toxin family protein [Neolewinella lacunae]|uniref:Nucleotidyl transferase AbiEii/AbiGii toxin family protein n=1 Tax=Neolewinella lacunae TaxID=1517758 RepID=A0A923PFZ2_9BACT|nr:nucleotidyl transferase AbiEii/AbiGii toxin family protein [Neolewinella lacunae]MBC6993362.1 nucleotidyl transferase AbiEii/AbiGii toxin family protein [Neolewinella lacunae]MDN3636352.1 nucleotidyl transferase AbiEii/AbiGii toxin family protein [Neolewinella lacunae]
MKLHHDIKLFSDILRVASQHLDIKLEFLEKDYWITLVLSRLAKSKFVGESVFKGGTSLSKAYNLIERFSEDVDIAIINDKERTGNEIKTIIRTIEKEITPDLNELQMDGVTSKGSRFRKSVFEYVATEKSNLNNKLIVEINSFANPFPFKKLAVKSLVHDFLMQTSNLKYIDQYNLHSFEVNVLSKEQTLLEKMVSLIRVSFKEDVIESVSEKIRHFYDLYYLMGDRECVEFVASDSFKKKFDAILQHDRKIFEEPRGWQGKVISESPLVNDFSIIWQRLKGKYQTELSALAYRPIPNEREVAKCFEGLIKRIK